MKMQMELDGVIYNRRFRRWKQLIANIANSILEDWRAGPMKDKLPADWCGKVHCVRRPRRYKAIGGRRYRK